LTSATIGTIVLGGLALTSASGQTIPTAAGPAYLGESDAVVMNVPGCNATSPVQIPGTTDLFINRQHQLANGTLPGSRVRSAAMLPPAIYGA